MNNLDCYKVLGLRPGVTTEQVRRAYKRLAMRYHPDRTGGDPHSHRLFCQVTEAYAVLKKALHLQNGGRRAVVCPKCNRVAALYGSVDGRLCCADCLLATRRKFLPLPTFRQIRCLAAMALQGAALYCLFVSFSSGDWQPGLAGISFSLASLVALACNLLMADVIER